MATRFPPSDSYHDEIINMEEGKYGTHHHHRITHNEPAWNDVDGGQCLMENIGPNEGSPPGRSSSLTHTVELRAGEFRFGGQKN
ncbi:hypothetical protein N7451_006489 [Penicillium sp. IBT 35674x]|nr:hypothetical protein N7451_006489 [Penicillium sp. IBT 35674x]